MAIAQPQSTQAPKVMRYTIIVWKESILLLMFEKERQSESCMRSPRQKLSLPAAPQEAA